MMNGAVRNVIDLEEAKAQRMHARAVSIALARAATVSDLVADLEAYQPGPERTRVAWYYVAKGWATDSDMRLALEELSDG